MNEINLNSVVNEMNKINKAIYGIEPYPKGNPKCYICGSTTEELGKVDTDKYVCVRNH